MYALWGLSKQQVLLGVCRQTSTEIRVCIISGNRIQEKECEERKGLGCCQLLSLPSFYSQWSSKKPRPYYTVLLSCWIDDAKYFARQGNNTVMTNTGFRCSTTCTCSSADHAKFLPDECVILRSAFGEQSVYQQGRNKNFGTALMPLVLHRSCVKQ